MFLLISFFTLVCFCALVAVKYPSYRQRKKYLEEIPSPPSYPVIGNALDITSSVDIFEKFKQWKQTYGNLFKLSVGPLLMYVTSDISLTEKILSSNTMIKKSRFYDFVHPWIGTGLITSWGQKWRKRRKAISPTFHFKILEQFLDVFDKHGITLTKILEKEVNKPSIEITKLMSLCTLDIICDTAMGVHHNAQESANSPYVKATQNLAKNALERSFTMMGQNDLTYSLTSMYREDKKNLKIVHDFTESVIKQKREELASNKTNSCINDESNFGIKKKVAFLDMLLETAIDGKPLNNADIREEVDSFMFAGHDTTACTLSFLLYLLSKNPDAQTKVYNEVMDISQGDVNKNFNYSELQSLKYMDMVIKETMRLFPIVPYIGREVTEEFEHNGYKFLKGATVLIYIYGVHTDPNIYAEPLKFDPERWTAAVDSKNAYCYTPFSAGPRNCVGQKFAMLEMRGLIAKIVKKFEIVPANPEVEIVLANEGVLKSTTGVHIALKRRKTNT